MKQRLIAIVMLSVLVTGCAAGRAFRRGNDAARAGDWDAAVVEYTVGSPGTELEFAL